MKKLTVMVMMACLSLGAFAQGTIIFQNTSTTLVGINQGDGTPVDLAPLGTHVAFYYAPASAGLSDPLSSSFNLIGNGVGTIAPIAGRFSLGTKTTGTDVPGAGQIEAVVRGWTGNYTDWASAYAAGGAGTPGVYVGWTPVLTMGTGDPAHNVPAVALNTVAGFNGLLIGVPEPTTVALVGMGAAALMISRRRK